jgi:hypothetical protein
MATRIYGATDLKTRRTELLGEAVRGRALVRAVDGTALVLTRLAAVEAQDCVATWALRLHALDADDPTSAPLELEWLGAFDAEDRAVCLDELWHALLKVRAEEDRSKFDETLRAWRVTAEALADPERRKVLLGVVEVDDFVVADRPG